MSDTKKTPIILKDIGRPNEIIGAVESMLSKADTPELIYIQLDPAKYPNRLNSLPMDVRKYIMTHPRVKVEWDYNVDIFTSKQDDSTNERKLEVSLITCHYGGKMNFNRKTAMLQALYNWFIQSHIPNDIIFIELVIDGDFMFSRSDFPSFVKYVRVEGNKNNKGVFQKECLWNIGAKLAINNKMIFVDYDTSPVGDVDWFYKIDKQLDKSLFTQGFRKITYLVQNGSSQFSNYCMTYVIAHKLERGDAVPGGSYCIRRELYNAIGGFNNRCFSGCGDAVFFNELQKKYIDTYYYNISINMSQRSLNLNEVQQIAKKLGMDLFGSLDIDLCHYFHGNMSDRSYNVREYLALMLYPFNDYFYIDERGLISWRYLDVSLYDSFCAINKLNNSISKAQKMIGKSINLAFFKKRIDEIRRIFEKTQSEYLLNREMNKMIDYVKENYWRISEESQR